MGYLSSTARENKYKQLTTNKTATSLNDMLLILGNKEDDSWPIFNDRSTARVNTINLGESIVPLYHLKFINIDDQHLYP